MNNTKTLKLTLNKKAFEVMVTGEKTTEFRNPSEWIQSRLSCNGKNKHYDFVKFTNGYGADKPFFIAEYKGWDYAYMKRTIDYSNGLQVCQRIDDIRIYLGKIVETGNLKE